MRARPWFVALGITLSVAVAAATFTPPPALADWSNVGNLVAGGAVDEQTGFAFTSVGTAVAPDAAGGCFVAYLFGDSIRVNRLSGDNGARLWGATGVKVNQGGNAAGAPHVVSDLEGGCWVVWLDSRSGNNQLYAQRFDPNGNALGTAAGFMFAGVVSTSQPFGQAIAASPGGDLLVAYWRTAALGMEVQRIHMQSGSAPSVEMGPFQVTTDTGSASDAPIQLFADGLGGGVVVWASNRGTLPGGAGTVKIVASRFNAAGAKQWGTEGAVVQAGAGASSIGHRSHWDGTSLYVAWRHGTSTSVTGVRAQRLDGNGVAQWATNATGLNVTDNLNTPFDDHLSTHQQPQVAPDGAGGIWVGWIDGRNWTQPAPNGFQHAQDIYVQRLNSAGTAQLQASGAPVDSFPGSVAELKVAPGANGELLMVYRSLLNEAGSLGDIHAIRVNTAGARVNSHILNKTGSPSIADGRQENPCLVPDGLGGMFVAWDDNRADPNLDVYATHRTAAMSLAGPSITVVSPNGGEALQGMAPTPITWTSTLPPTATLRIEYKVGSSRFLLAAAAPNTGSFTWYPPNNMTTAYRVVVSEAADGVPSDSSNANFSVCSPIEVPGAWGPFTAPNDVALADLNHDGILDLLVPGSAGLYVEMGQGTAGVGNGGFGNTQTTALPSSARDVVVADLDGDGNRDAVVSTSTGITVLAGLGNGSFTVGPSYATGANVRGLALGDFNSDGIADVAAVNGTDNTVSVLLGQGANGNGNGLFSAAVSFAVGANPSRVIARHFDGDGILDLAVTCNSGSSVAILMGDGFPVGNGSFDPANLRPTGASPLGLASGDFNEDGVVDLAVATSTGVSVLLGNGTSAFTPFVAYSVGAAARDVEVVDFNGDGRQDLMLVTGTTDRVHVLYGNGSGATGDGTFTLGGNDFMGDQPTAIAIGDLLEDNIPDGVVVNGLGNDAYVFWGRCTNPQSGAITVTSPNGGNYLQIGVGHTITWTKGAGVQLVNVEVSRDNGATWETIAERVPGTSLLWHPTAPEAILSCRVRVRDAQLQNRFDDSNNGFTIGAASLMVLDPNGGQSLTAFDGVVARWGAAPFVATNVKLELEVNGVLQTLSASTPNDGFEFFFVPNVESDSVRLRVSDAADGAPSDLSDAFFAICGRMGAGATPASVVRSGDYVAGDFNSDGITDLVVAPFVSDSIAVHLGQGAGGVGNGTFLPAVSYPASGIEDRLATGDFNGDGITDVVAAGFAGGVRLLLGQGAGGVGNGAFGAAINVPTGTAGRDVAVADFNEDGIDDIAVAAFGLDQVEVLIGQGSGGIGNATFAAAVGYPVQDGPNRIVVADFDEDGIWDLAVTNHASNSVSVLLGDGAGGVGDGTFAAAVHYAAPAGPFVLLATEAGDDSRLDLVVGGNGGLWTLLGGGAGGVGDGTFPDVMQSFLDPDLQDFEVMDVNFDEFADLVGVKSFEQEVAFLTNDSGADFGEVGSVALPAAATLGVLAGDFNEDGFHDVAATLTVERQTAILLGAGCGQSPGTVTIDPPAPQPAAATARMAGSSRAAGTAAATRTTANWALGSNQVISWTKSPNVFGVDLAVSRNGGASWRTIARGVPGNSFTWTVTPPSAANVLLRASASSSPGAGDATDTPVVIGDGSVGVGDPELPVAASFALGSPNPARGEVAFELALPSEQHVTVEAFDVSGRRVATLASGRFAPGYHALRWPQGGAGAGIYFVRARWAGFDATERVVRLP